jgi:hypothetical protein
MTSPWSKMQRERTQQERLGNQQANLLYAHRVRWRRSA